MMLRTLAPEDWQRPTPRAAVAVSADVVAHLTDTRHSSPEHRA